MNPPNENFFIKLKNELLQLIKISIIPMALMKGLQWYDIFTILIPFMFPYLIEGLYILYTKYKERNNLKKKDDKVIFNIYRMSGNRTWYNKTFMM